MNNIENKSAISIVHHNSRTNPPLKSTPFYVAVVGGVISMHAEIGLYRGSSYGLDTLVGDITGIGPIECVASELGYALANAMRDLVEDLPQITWAEDAHRMGSGMTMVMAAAVASLVKCGHLILPFKVIDLVPYVQYENDSPRGNTISYLSLIFSDGLVDKCNSLKGGYHE